MKKKKSKKKQVDSIFSDEEIEFWVDLMIMGMKSWKGINEVLNDFADQVRKVDQLRESNDKLVSISDDKE